MPLQTFKHTPSFQIEELKDLFYFTSTETFRAALGEPRLRRETSPRSICTDSREIGKGKEKGKNQIFLPLKGEKFDGHDFINDVFEKEALLLSFCGRNEVQRVKEKYRANLIIVNNTLDAYHLLAGYYRRKVNPKVIAVTGSSGKTTTKDLIASVLGVKFKTHKTEENFNNEFGVPKTILEMKDDTEVLVLEMAMRGKGEIGYLSKTALPDIAVITNVGAAHIGRLGSMDKIIKAKCELLEFLKKDGLAVLHNDQKLLQYANELWSGKTAVFDINDVSDISFKDTRSYFRLVANHTTDEKYSVSALGNVHVLNSLLAILIAKYLGLTKEEIQKGLLDFKIPSGRGNIVKLKEDVYLVDESYNANPDSVKAAVNNLIDCWTSDYKKILVLGELAELGEHEERLLVELGKWLASKHLAFAIDTVITVGDKFCSKSLPWQASKAINVKDTSECCDILKGLLIPKSVTLVKGSHVAGLEKVISFFYKEPRAKWRNNCNGKTKN